MALTDLIIGNPKISIIILAFVVSFVLTIVRYYMTDREKMKEIRGRQKELRAQMKEFKDNPEKMMEINKRMLEDMPEQLKQSFKPMLVTIIPLLIMFAWLRSTYSPILSSWIWWYIGASMISSIFFSKVFGLQ